MEPKDFFNRIAGSYQSKYGESQPFHHYFFTERLREATRGLPIDHQRIIDIGAGTGDLCEYIAAHYDGTECYASDVAEEMLARSNIPAANRRVGNIYDTDLPVGTFDLAFMLGVTTYLSPDEREKNFAHIRKLLKPGSTFVLTFTNRSSLDWAMRTLLRPVVRRVGGRDRVLAQIDVSPLRHAEATHALERYFDVVETRWLNHTVFPWSVILARPSVWLARKLHRRLQASFLRSWLSADFLVIAKAK